MTEAELIDIARDGISTLIFVAAPPLLTGLAVGLVISILQTITQIQEMTLTFVPKVLLVFGSIILFLPFMLGLLTDFWKSMLDRVITGGG
ncbi:MAG: flagellar biosynthetic protein [Rhodospirillaceae bacterium]|jgi:flagellar biosynthesis protein FliQ|uniref:Flagellar biosynthetic protein FliQ n=1 Tax=Magnetospirillum gryphiswaldense (strain DSM 6361 / JCM 21280 / NBRC 15271 / MSR-1) TaxID=431944 RepID=V6F6T7_MAGGM|nr:flagellar biosynthesis protein FliQ [Magnetospirillum gryphiswaldense]KAF0224950.1 MAG: flagellar biosynthetic protein [Rhodospirillaceae bacterium]TNC94483.1 MAG: flagellar biosynthetic protein FliQ [Stygiobacter sp.]CDL00198.1 Flagellar biosynthetic protein FliQ [Magnetospirillum gryphiswaldense MSR-1 v2]